jgi:hypothetical protein
MGYRRPAPRQGRGNTKEDKSEYRISKYETNSNDRNSNVQNVLNIWSFENSNLFRASYFGFRIFILRASNLLVRRTRLYLSID